jgi:hypothetical protein
MGLAFCVLPDGDGAWRRHDADTRVDPPPDVQPHGHAMTLSNSLWIASLAVAVHSFGMLLVTGVTALVAYKWIGLGFLRRGWINLDLVR